MSVDTSARTRFIGDGHAGEARVSPWRVKRRKTGESTRVDDPAIEIDVAGFGACSDQRQPLAKVAHRLESGFNDEPAAVIDEAPALSQTRGRPPVRKRSNSPVLDCSARRMIAETRRWYSSHAVRSSGVSASPSWRCSAQISASPIAGYRDALTPWSGFERPRPMASGTKCFGSSSATMSRSRMVAMFRETQGSECPVISGRAAGAIWRR